MKSGELPELPDSLSFSVSSGSLGLTISFSISGVSFITGSSLYFLVTLNYFFLSLVLTTGFFLTERLVSLPPSETSYAGKMASEEAEGERMF